MKRWPVGGRVSKVQRAVVVEHYFAVPISRVVVANTHPSTRRFDYYTAFSCKFRHRLTYHFAPFISSQIQDKCVARRVHGGLGILK